MNQRYNIIRQDDTKKLTGFSYWVLVFAFALFFSPKSYAVGTNVFRVWRVAEAIVSLVAIILYIARERISLRWVLFVLFLGTYYLLSTFLMRSDGKIRTAGFYALSIAGFVTLLEYGLRRDRDACLDAVLLAGLIMCSVHYATYLRYRRLPLGMRSSTFDLVGELTRHPWFFFTHDNGSVFYFLPMIGGLWYRAIEREKDILIAIVFSVATLYMYWNLNTVTAKLVTTFFVACIVILYRYGTTALTRKLSYRLALLIGLGFCIAVICFNSNDFFVQVARRLGKSSDMGRGRIWQRALPIIWESPVFGVGFESDATTSFKLGINHCHNLVVQILYTGGIVSFVCFITSLVRYNVPLQYRNQPITTSQAVLLLNIILFFVCATFDWYLYMPIQFLPFLLFSYSFPAVQSGIDEIEMNDERIRLR